MNDENDSETEVKLTPIPEGGWTPEHLGNTVILKMEYGTVVEDRIIRMELNGHVFVGPSLEIGMLLARQDYIGSAIEVYENWQKALRDSMEDLE